MATEPHFVKIIVEYTIRKLCIPKKFIRQYGKKLPVRVYLEVSSGQKWEVGLTISQRKVWMNHGLESFIRDCQVHYGHFLTFRYNLDDGFHVVIFDKSCTEIEYPFFKKSRDHQKGRAVNSAGESTDDEDDDDDDDYDDDEIEEEEDEYSDDSSEDFRPYPRKPKRTTKKSRDSDDDISLEFLDNHDYLHPKKKMKSKKSSLGSQHCETKIRKKTPSKRRATVRPKGWPGAVNKKKEIRAIENSRHFQKPYFSLAMQPTMIGNPRHLISIPSAFGRENFDRGGSITAMLSTDKRQKWPLRYYTYHREMKQYTAIETGWRQFVEDNGLGEGDICVFELMKEDDMVLKVSIFRA